MAAETRPWDGEGVRRWLASRIAAARTDQVTAERGGRVAQDDCDKATAEEMVCTLAATGKAADATDTFAASLRALLDREEYIWRGIHDDRKFDRHVRTYIKKLLRMTKANDGFANVAHYQ